MNCVRKRKNTHYPFTTENAANDGPVIFSSLFTTKALSPRHMAHAIKCVCKPQVERKLFTTNYNSASHRKTKARNKVKGKKRKKFICNYEYNLDFVLLWKLTVSCQLPLETLQTMQYPCYCANLTPQRLWIYHDPPEKGHSTYQKIWHWLSVIYSCIRSHQLHTNISNNHAANPSLTACIWFISMHHPKWVQSSRLVLQFEMWME